MKVLHVPYVFAPDPMGGTEVYVASLAREQAARGIRPEIAAPAAGNAEYEIDGLPVHRFGSTAQPSLRALYREGDPLAAENFARILDRVGPDLVHFHALSTAISVLTMRAAKRRGQPVVFTYHTPTVSCMRGTLLEWGRTTCDGTVSVSRCAPCALHSRGVPAPLSRLAGALPAGFGRTLGHLNLAGGAWTALRATELSGLYADGFREFLSHPDAIVVPCLWSAEVLRRNGIPDERLTLSRQGFAKPPAPAARVARRREPGKPIRLVFLGRLDPTKGVDLLLEATRRAPEGLVELDVYGVVQHDGASTGRYLERLRALASGSRIRLLPPIPSTEVQPLLAAQYDALMAPSQWLETGPLVVLEAFAAGLPVIGSNLGGIAELVTSGTDGLLVEPADTGAWTAAMVRLASEPGLLERLREGVRPPKTMADVAIEMEGLYQRLAPAGAAAH